LQNVLTEAWIYEPEELRLVERFMNFLLREREVFERREAASRSTNLMLKGGEVLYGPGLGDAPHLSHTQLFIELKEIPEPHPTECHYYFADDRLRNIFWLEAKGYPLDPILDAVAGKLDPEHISTFIYCGCPHLDSFTGPFRA
jgi:hypothetical protein